jgi:hypothetical protein
MAAPAPGKLVNYLHPSYGPCAALVTFTPAGLGSTPPLDLLVFPKNTAHHHTHYVLAALFGTGQGQWTLL